MNNLRPTRNLKARFLLQSRKIQTLTRQYDARLLTTWQFIQTVAYSSNSYFTHQINWINEVGGNVEPEPEIIVIQQEDEVDEPQADIQIIPQQNISVCIVCMYNTETNSQRHIIIPCGHGWVCNICIIALPEPVRCPLC